MENNEMDLSKVHKLALFRQYYGITHAMWQMEHMASHGWGGLSIEKEQEARKECIEALNPIKLEILKRLDLTEEDGTFHPTFKAWYAANDSFIFALSDDEYNQFEKAEAGYVGSDFADSTEFEKILEKLNYEQYITEKLAGINV